MQNNNENVMAEYAGFWIRLFAYFVDTVVIGLPLLIVRLILWLVTLELEGTAFTKHLLFQYNIADIILYLIHSSYFIACTYLTGTTVGKRLLNLKVVSTDEEEKLELIHVIYRETIGRFLNGIFCNIGYILVGLDKEKRGIHDILCDTRVVYAKKIKTYEIKNTVTLPERVVEADAEAETETETVQVPPGMGYAYVSTSETNTENREEFIDENE